MIPQQSKPCAPDICGVSPPGSSSSLSCEALALCSEREDEGLVVPLAPKSFSAHGIVAHGTSAEAFTKICGNRSRRRKAALAPLLPRWLRGVSKNLDKLASDTMYLEKDARHLALRSFVLSAANARVSEQIMKNPMHPSYKVLELFRYVRDAIVVSIRPTHDGRRLVATVELMHEGAATIRNICREIIEAGTSLAIAQYLPSYPEYDPDALRSREDSDKLRKVAETISGLFS